MLRASGRAVGIDKYEYVLRSMLWIVYMGVVLGFILWWVKT
jgi:hypothetical protein